MRRNAGDAGLRLLERRARATRAPVDAQAYGQALRRQGGFDDALANMLDTMGPEAWLAWLFDGEYEWRPDEDVDGAVAYPDPVDSDDDDANLGLGTWRRMLALTGLAVRRRHDDSPMLVRTYWTVDDGNNLDSTGEDDWPLGSPESDLALAQRTRDTLQGWADYFEWVAERGEDPLNELRLVRQEPESSWRFELEPKVGRGRTKKRPLDLVRKAWQRRGRRWVVTPVARLPERVRAWLAVQAWPPHAKLEVVLPGDEAYPTEVEVISAATQRRADAEVQLAFAVRDVRRLIAVANAIIEVDTNVGVERLMRSQVADRFAFEVGMVLRPGDARFPDAVRAVDDTVNGHRYTEIRVISGPEDGGTSLIYDHATSLFWNNSTGWVDRGTAQRFHSRDGVNLPHGSQVAWVTVADLPALPHSPDCYCMECVHDVDFCPACGNVPDEGNIMNEHEADCSSEGEMVCASHHVCDSLSFDEGAEGEHAADELGEDS